MNPNTPPTKVRSLMRWLDPLPLPKDTPQTPIDISGDLASGVVTILCAGLFVAIYLLAVGW